MSRVVLYLILLTLTYALVLASFHPWDLAIGAALSGALLFAFRRFLFPERAPESGGLAGRMVAFVPFAAVAVREILVGTWEVALVTLHLRPLYCPGIVAVPIAERTPVGVAVTALVDTLSPGTVLVDVDRERDVMLIHTIDASDPEAVREHHEKLYRRYQSKVFP